MTEFGSLGGVLAGAQLRQQRVVPNEGAALKRLRGLRSLILSLLRVQVAERPVLGNWRVLLDYLKLDLGPWPMERARVLYLDARNRLIRDELVSIGSIDEAAIYVEAVLRRAIELGAGGIILAHNHPSGESTPSRTDIALTERMVKASKLIGINVHDHIVIAGNAHSSMRSLGLI